MKWLFRRGDLQEKAPKTKGLETLFRYQTHDRSKIVQTTIKVRIFDNSRIPPAKQVGDAITEGVERFYMRLFSQGMTDDKVQTESESILEELKAFLLTQFESWIAEVTKIEIEFFSLPPR